MGSSHYVVIHTIVNLKSVHQFFGSYYKTDVFSSTYGKTCIKGPHREIELGWEKFHVFLNTGAAHCTEGMMEGMNIQQVDDHLELANGLLTHGLLGRVNGILYKLATRFFIISTA